MNRVTEDDRVVPSRVFRHREQAIASGARSVRPGSPRLHVDLARCRVVIDDEGDHLVESILQIVDVSAKLFVVVGEPDLSHRWDSFRADGHKLFARTRCPDP